MNQQNAFQYHLLLEGMKEGVLAVDKDHVIQHVNSSAARFLNISSSQSLGQDIRYLLESEHPVLEVIEEVLANAGTPEKELRLSQPQRTYLQVSGQLLRTQEGEVSGAMLVFSDMTRLRILEDHRRAFVSNVSHELKTPLTTIQGFVETLLSGAYKRQEECLRFLNIIERHSQRLGSIIEDLLTLSRLENETESAAELLTLQKLASILNMSLESCRENAERKKIKIELNCEQGLQARINSGLLEQALVNLLDNAVKYSEEGSQVKVTAEKTPSWIQIRVEDNGPGIAPEHLERLFERFYRVDKARSRKVGGTGLGLSIVKHIALAHRGNVRVESRVGQGSRFILELPLEGD